MIRTFLKSKLHRVRVTEADLHYEGSCGIDADLLDLADVRQYEHIEIYNINNGERFTTYVIAAPRGSGVISLNGAAARKAMVGDLLIIASYTGVEDSEIDGYEPTVVLADEHNRGRLK